MEYFWKENKKFVIAVGGGLAFLILYNSIVLGPIRRDAAMTGEITLRGKVLSVGGIKEKVMAAQRANIKTVVLPEGNRRDLTEVPDEVKEGLQFVFAERVEDVWKESLIPLYIVRTRDRKYDEAEYKAERQNQKSERDRPEQR